MEIQHDDDDQSRNLINPKKINRNLQWISSRLVFMRLYVIIIWCTIPNIGSMAEVLHQSGPAKWSSLPRACFYQIYQLLLCTLNPLSKMWRNRWKSIPHSFSSDIEDFSPKRPSLSALLQCRAAEAFETLRDLWFRTASTKAHIQRNMQSKQIASAKYMGMLCSVHTHLKSHERICSSWSWYHSLLSAKLRSKWWNFFHPQHQLLLVTRAENYLILACRTPTKSIKSHVVGFSTMQHGTLTPGKLNECAVMTKLLSTTVRYLHPLYIKSKVLLQSRDNMFAFCLVKWQRLQ